jgi:hypothetical protein
LKNRGENELGAEDVALVGGGISLLDSYRGFFAEIFGLRVEGSGGHFAPVRVNDTLTLDFADAKGPSQASIMRFT